MKHYETRIYQKSLELVEITQTVINSLPGGFGYLSDQMRRAVSSVTLNYSEGYSRYTRADQQRFFRTAKASACELQAAFDIAYKLKLIKKELHHQAFDLADYVAAMLTKFRRK